MEVMAVARTCSVASSRKSAGVTRELSQEAEQGAVTWPIIRSPKLLPRNRMPTIEIVANDAKSAFAD